MIVRKAELEDLDRAMQILDAGRQHMRGEGNSAQWTNGYPSRELIRSDIEQGRFFVWLDETEKERDPQAAIHGVFSFIIGEDPTYAYIENGAWPNDKPYGTIHRMASDGSRKGMLRECLQFCRSRIPEIRIDTHEQNATMRQACRRLGFLECGIIFQADGSPRIAYQLEDTEKQETKEQQARREKA